MSGVHFLLELGSAVACLVTAHFAWGRYRSIRSGYNLLWFAAFLTTAVADLAHGALSFHPDLAEVWLPWTWACSRLTLAGCLGAAIWMSGRRMSCRRMRPVITGATASVAAAVALVATYLGATAILFSLPLVMDVSWVRFHGGRPLDLLLACVWAGLVAATIKVEAAQIQAPQTFELFALLGLASHLVMAFGALTLPNTYSLVAHVLKLAEYWAWAGAAWWEERQARREGGIGRVLQQRFQERRMDQVWAQLQRTTHRLNARLTELSENLEEHASELRRTS